MTPARRWIAAVLAIAAVAALVFAFTGDPSATSMRGRPLARRRSGRLDESTAHRRRRRHQRLQGALLEDGQ
jgi:hypothetical protein